MYIPLGDRKSHISWIRKLVKENMRLQMRFSIINMYKKIDNLKLMWRKQMLLKHRYRNQYQNLLKDYKQLLVENNELKRGNRTSW